MPGERFVQKDLAASLEQLAEKGRGAFMKEISLKASHPFCKTTAAV